MQPIAKSPVVSGNAEHESWESKPEPENPFPVPEGWNPYPEGEAEKPKTTRAKTTTTAVPMTGTQSTVAQTTAVPTTVPPTTRAPTTGPLTTGAFSTEAQTTMAATTRAFTTAGPNTPPPTTPTPCPPANPNCSLPISQVCLNINESSVPLGSTPYNLCNCTQNNFPTDISTAEKIAIANAAFACSDVINTYQCNSGAVTAQTRRYLDSNGMATISLVVCDAFQRFVIGNGT